MKCVVELELGGGVLGAGGNAIISGPFVVLVVSLNVSGEELVTGSRVIVDISAL